MRGWLFPYGIWYTVAVLCALGAAAGSASGDVPGAALNGATAAVVVAVTVRSRTRWSRSGEKAARVELMRLVDERPANGVWLNRDAHLLFSTTRRRVAGMRERMLMVVDEDQLRDVDDMQSAGGGKIAVTGVSYRAHPVFARVLRHADGAVALVTADDIEEDPDEREPGRQGYAAMIRTLRAGLLFADSAELAEVAAQFRDAEQVRRSDPEGPEEWERAS